MATPFDPYAPPADAIRPLPSASPTAAGPTIVREEGNLLVVSHGARLDGPCVKCAARGELVRRSEILRHLRPLAWLWLLTGILGVVIVSLLERTATVALPICLRCDAAWNRVVRRRSVATLSLFPVSITAMGGFVAAAKGLLPGVISAWMAVGLFTAWGVTYAAFAWGPSSRRSKVAAAWIDRKLIALRGVHPDARKALRAGT